MPEAYDKFVGVLDKLTLQKSSRSLTVGTEKNIITVLLIFFLNDIILFFIKIYVKGCITLCFNCDDFFPDTFPQSHTKLESQTLVCLLQYNYNVFICL